MSRLDASPRPVRLAVPGRPRLAPTSAFAGRPRLAPTSALATFASLFFVACSSGTSGPLAPPPGTTRPTAEPVASAYTGAASTGAASTGATSTGGASTAGASTPGGDVRTPVDPRPERCATDDDCVVTTFTSCCHPCGRGDSRADLRWRADDAEASCAAVKCPQRPPVACAPPIRHAHERAVCRAGACELDLTPPRAPSARHRVHDGGALAGGCARDSDCAASTFDGCCTACTCPEPHPILKANLARESEACRVIECPRGDYKTCMACPPVAPLEPACRDARCVLVSE